MTYRMLTGRLPFDGEDYMSILMQQLSAPPPSACELYADLPEHVDRVIGWMLAKSPADRPTSLTAAVRALAEGTGLETPGLGSSPAIAPPSLQLAVAAPTIPAAPAVPPRRKNLFLIAVATVPLIAAAITFVLLQRDGDSAKPPIAAPAPAPEPTTVVVTVRGLPVGTRVSVDGTQIAEVRGASTELWLPRGPVPKTLRFERDGYEPTDRTVSADQPSTLELALVAIAPPATPAPPQPASVAKSKSKSKSKPKPKPKSTDDGNGQTGPTGPDAIEPPKGLFDDKKTP
jgi:serine/threonine-protein kinase